MTVSHDTSHQASPYSQTVITPEHEEPTAGCAEGHCELSWVPPLAELPSPDWTFPPLQPADAMQAATASCCTRVLGHRVATTRKNKSGEKRLEMDRMRGTVRAGNARRKDGSQLPSEGKPAAEHEAPLTDGRCLSRWGPYARKESRSSDDAGVFGGSC